MHLKTQSHRVHPQEAAKLFTEFTTYDAAGNPVETLDAHGGLTRRTYDAANRLIREVSAAGRHPKYSTMIKPGGCGV